MIKNEHNNYRLFNNRYFRNIIAYQSGMICYIRDNEIIIPRTYIYYNLIIGILQELKEFIIEIIHLRFKDALIELFDIWHALIVFIFMLLTPKSVWLSRKIWTIIYFISVGIAPFKHGNRYIDHKCIRNINHCLKNDHICNVNRRYRV